MPAIRRRDDADRAKIKIDEPRCDPDRDDPGRNLDQELPERALDREFGGIWTCLEIGFVADENQAEDQHLERYDAMRDRALSQPMSPSLLSWYCAEHRRCACHYQGPTWLAVAVTSAYSAASPDLWTLCSASKKPFTGGNVAGGRARQATGNLRDLNKV